MKIEQEYYVIENDGKFLGTAYEDGHCTVEGYIEPFNESELSVSVPMSSLKTLAMKRLIHWDCLDTQM